MLYTATRRRTAHAKAAQSKEGWLEGSYRLPDKVGKEYMRSIFRKLLMKELRLQNALPLEVLRGTRRAHWIQSLKSNSLFATKL